MSNNYNNKHNNYHNNNYKNNNQLRKQQQQQQKVQNNNNNNQKVNNNNNCCHSRHFWRLPTSTHHFQLFILQRSSPKQLKQKDNEVARWGRDGEGLEIERSPPLLAQTYTCETALKPGTPHPAPFLAPQHQVSAPAPPLLVSSQVPPFLVSSGVPPLLVSFWAPPLLASKETAQSLLCAGRNQRATQTQRPVKTGRFRYVSNNPENPEATSQGTYNAPLAFVFCGVLYSFSGKHQSMAGTHLLIAAAGQGCYHSLA